MDCLSNTQHFIQLMKLSHTYWKDREMNTPPPHDINNCCTRQTIRVVVVFNSDGSALLFWEGVIEIEMFNNMPYTPVRSSAVPNVLLFRFDWMIYFDK